MTIRIALALGVIALGATVFAQTPLPPDPPILHVAEPPPSDAPPAPEKPKLEALWDNGLFLRTKDKAFNIHLGGMFHYDGAWYDATPGLQLFPGGVGRFNDGVAMRRGRLRADGTLYKDFSFQLEFDFANAATLAGAAPPNNSFAPVVPLEAWIQADHVPWLGHVRVGLQKEWFSLEHAESARFLTFIERSYLFDAGQPTAFNNGRTPGVAAFRPWADDRAFTAVGIYKNISNAFGLPL